MDYPNVRALIHVFYFSSVSGSEPLLPVMETSLLSLTTRLSELDDQSPVLKAAQGFQSLCNRELIPARDCFVQGIPKISLIIFFVQCV